MAERSCALERLVARGQRLFEEKFNHPPRWIVAAPGRVNLIGEHTDYNDGYVLPMAIDRYTVIAADRPLACNGAADGPRARLFSAELNEWATIAVEGELTPEPVSWSSYVKGVIAGCLAAGLAVGSVDALIVSDVPVGGGLSSSAALEVATATLIEAVCGRSLDPVAKALLCQKAEHEFAGMPCGIMDQFSSIMGRRDNLMLLDCRSQHAELVPLAAGDVSVLIVNSNVKHELTGGAYAQRRAQCESAARRLGVPALRDATPRQLEQARETLDPIEYRRARHVVGEIERTVSAARAIALANWPAVGEVMYASHASLRDDYEVSCDELDRLVLIAQSLGDRHGIIGSRMTGGGFGGCTVSLVRSGAVETIERTIAEDYRNQTGIEPAVFATRPAEGAQIVKA